MVNVAASGNWTGWGPGSRIVSAWGALGYSRPNRAARPGSPPKWMMSRQAGTEIANTLIQNWKAWT